MDRVVLMARLKPNSRKRAQKLLAEYPSHERLRAAFHRQAVFLSETEAVFFFEGPDADRSVTAILNDPSLTEIGHWLPVFDGPLHRAREAYLAATAGSETSGRSRRGGLLLTLRLSPAAPRA